MDFIPIQSKEVLIPTLPSYQRKFEVINIHIFRQKHIPRAKLLLLITYNTFNSCLNIDSVIIKEMVIKPSECKET